MILIDDFDLQKIVPTYPAISLKDRPTGLKENVMVTTLFSPRSIYAGATYRMRGISFDNPIEQLVKEALSKVWGRKVWVSHSEGEEVGDDAYCQATVFRADDDS
jgi:hypothetical protein